MTADNGYAEHLLKKDDAPPRKRALLRYILVVATLAFTGRAAPLAFLPLVLKTDFDQPDYLIGIVMALYPMAALLSTPWAARESRRTQRIVTLHSFAILTIALAMALTSLATDIQSWLGTTYGVLWISACRALQGVGASLYLSSNTSLIARMFPEQMPYIIAMTEVAVGSGGQIGRLCGGFLFGAGGFACPFLVLAAVQATAGIVGFAFEEGPPQAAKLPHTDTGACTERRERALTHSKIPWQTLFTPRVAVGATAAFMMYFIATFGDATLLQYLVVHLAPVTVQGLSVAMSARGMTYLVSSYFIAQVMHRELISYECLIGVGSLLAMAGQLILAPQPFVVDWLGEDATTMWSVQIAAFVLSQLSGALMFVPSLPLMQSEVRIHGIMAVEQVAELFVTMMTLGELVGPVFGGWIVGQIGFIRGTLALALTCLPLLALTLLTYDAATIKDRRLASRSVPVVAVPDLEDDKGVAICGPRCAPTCGPPSLVTDGEGAFTVRRIPFALDVHQVAEEDAGSCGSL
eukprot:TRINITY_DN19023_c0_g1_i1.p1 TRINITY_DN19023_c0_g1~~TRINITY_DN19023_c0_g1_i1.p1  ORF type:complete len:520 (+),score=59.17 TRINITY_DN19023_c0_g1_i1:171-1730(+)